MKSKIFLALLAVSLLCVFSALQLFHFNALGSAKENAQAVQILKSDARSLSLAFSPQKWSIDTLKIDQGIYNRANFLGAQFIERPDSLQIPYHVAVIGIPVNATVRYRILETDYETLDDIRLLPFPRVKKGDGSPEGEYFFDQQIYSQSQPFPSDLVRIDEPAFYRDQQIVRVQVAGAQYIAERNQLLKYNRIVLQLEFVGGQQGSQLGTAGRQSNLEEDLYKRAILNYEQASDWRQARQVDTRSEKRDSFLQNTIYYKFAINEEGIYRLDGEFLQSQNIDLSQIDPNKIRLFNNGGRELPRDIAASRPEGLVENAIMVEDGGDGRFDRGDVILFYGRGLEGWQYDSGEQKFEHFINHYGFDNIYWLSLDGPVDGKRMPVVNSQPVTGAIVDRYQGLAYVEEELQNPLRSGLNWFGREFGMADEIARTKTYNLNLPNAVPGEEASLQMQMASKSSGVHRFAISWNDNFAANRQFSGAGFGDYLIMQVTAASTFPAVDVSDFVQPGDNALKITYSHNLTSGQALLDWLELIYSARLQAVDDELAFTVSPDSGLKSYRVGNFSNNSLQLFDVTDYAGARQIVPASVANGALTFADFQAPDLPRRYIAITPSRFKTVEMLEHVEVRDLRNTISGAEFIIITHQDFYSEALRLESLRENGNPNNRLSTEVVRLSEIYNNFSAGLPDPTSIRDFLKFAYDNWNPRPVYVLLFGDGDFDYKNILSKGDKNWLPPYQTNDLEDPRNRLELLTSRTTDSWFTYVSGNDFVMDLGIGRIPAQTVTDAQNMVDKIIAYETQPLYGNWRNTITIVGDDELVTGGRPSAIDDIHLKQAEDLAEGFVPEFFDVEKIYLSEYPKVLSASVSGVRKPAAQEALIRQMNKGTLIVNFIGHGNPSQWAHEFVFQKADNDRVQNVDKLIFFVAATCDWALYDDPQSESQAEELLLAERRGAIAVLTAARLVYAGENARFNQAYYRNLFISNSETARLGDAFVQTRLQTGSPVNRNVNDEKFHIFGDPTMRLAMPQHEVAITSMNPDSILALSTVEVAGEVRQTGQLATDFNGKALVTTYDSRKFVRYIPEAGSAREYFLPGNSIYRGTVSVQNGKFAGKFIVPKDISYGGEQARISAYAWNEEAGTDASGFRDDILVSSSTSSLTDTQGPQIRLFFQGHENFTTGDIVGENVTLVAELADTVSSINIAGEIGHRITLSIDPDGETCISELNQFQGTTSIDLTDLFRFNEGDPFRGQVEFPLNFPKEVEVGGRIVQCSAAGEEQRHTLVLKAWDNSNNSSTASIEVLVVHEEGLVLREVMNYPNPFSNRTTFTFISNQDAEVQIKIYTVAGQLIRTLEHPFARNGFNMVEWDGRDASGDIPANGVYLYKLIATGQGTEGMTQKEIIGRLAIIR